jgi:cytochrome c
MNELQAGSERALLGCMKLTAASFAAFVLLVAVTIAAVVYESRAKEPPPGPLGDPGRGRLLVAAYGCTACHVVPGAAPQGTVGPPLTRFGRRSYIAGKFANDAIVLQEWLQHPREMKPGTAMPDLGVTDRDARDLAAYLSSLH